ncbi:MAG: phage portal protein, partial [Pirellulales bacterium]
MNTVDSALDRAQRRVIETLDDLFDRFVDPRDAICDDEGTAWWRIGANREAPGSPPAGCSTEEDLARIRAQCRLLAESNEFAINGHENRISYLVGTGHTYRAMATRRGADAELARNVQKLLEEFKRRNRWRARHEEIVRRRDRDGEVFLRFFPDAEGMTHVRFVEPGQVATPRELVGDAYATFGIETDPDDVETVRGYFVDGRRVPGGDIQHRKGNVDANVKRGLPLFYPVLKNLRRAEKLLRNMSILAEVQSAIALIRRHPGTSGAAQQFAQAQSDLSMTSPATGKTTHFKRYPPGTILDVHAGVEYDFPASRLDASSYVNVLKAELRAIASRLVMPEFMLTSDASNSNYASTLVAEGPAVKMFARLQAQLVEEDLDVLRRVIDHASAVGRLPTDARQRIEIQAVPPSLATRDAWKEALAFRIEHSRGVLSPQTWSQRRGLDYDQEQANLAEHRAARDAAKSKS